ncbi:MAG: hypothetical protein DRQ88_07560 [Epsilonproteobacteria bacterium]|nr:MAG: hypothetical protein DRQ89_03385 [Campylobacterota bacterium]RLA66180.1 MAG: hypothetical protein DRQ88_07560 [Campylobacterota bacterium]
MKKFVSLEKKFIFILGIFNAFVCILIPIALTSYRYQYQDLKIDRLIENIPKVIEKDVLTHMEPFNRKYFENFFQAAINVPQLKYLRLNDSQGNLLVEEKKGNQPDKYTQKLHYKLMGLKSGKHIGSVDLIVTRDKVYAAIKSDFLNIFIAMVIWSVFLSFFTWYFFKKILINPLNKFRNYLGNLKQGQTTFPRPLFLERVKLFRVRDQIDDVGEALEVATKLVIQGNIDNHNRYKIIEGEVIKRTEELLNEKQKSDEASQEKTEFISHISHEIRNPINAISGFVDLLDNKITDPEEKELIDPLKAATGNLLGLVNDLLDISKGELGKLKIDLKISETSKMFDNLQKVFAPRIKAKGLKYIVEIDPEFPAFIKIDNLRIAQIIQNLIGNALKFTEQGHIKVIVKTKKLSIQNKISLTVLVEDSGIGVPHSEREKIFEKYRQMTGQSYQKYQGSGLGLAISRKLAHLLGGELKVIDKEGPGACFELLLKEVEVASPEDMEQVVTEKEEFQFFDAKVLVVDDEKLNRDLINWNLRPYKLKLFFAEDGKEALNKALINKPDIILMDLLMPKMDGIESIELIKVYENLKNIPIIVISAVINSENEEKLKKLADGMMRKPVLQKDLVKELAKFLPHKVISKEQISEENKVTTLPVETSIAPELEKILREKYLPKIENLKEMMSINEIEIFANVVDKLATKHGSKVISAWAINMLSQTKRFNVDEIEKSFDNLEDLLKEKTAKKKVS